MEVRTKRVILMVFYSACIFGFVVGVRLRQKQFCVCAPYWQCNVSSNLIEDAIDIDDDIDVDVRNRESLDSLPNCQGIYDTCCHRLCGMRRTKSQEQTFQDVFPSRILGDNNEAVFGEFPWMLGVLEDKTYRCGASLIHPQVALTAAHCLTGKGDFVIRAGEWNWESVHEPIPHQDRRVKKVIIHPEYQPAALHNDVALIILEKPFRLTETIVPACLPNRGASFDGKRCITMGWGKNSHRKGTYQSILKKLELPIVARKQCVKILQDARLGPYFLLHESFICAGGEPRMDTCKGDGGSPLMCPIAGMEGRYEQVGIVSWGLTCGLQNVPGVYVNLAIFIEWIDFMLIAHGFA